MRRPDLLVLPSGVALVVIGLIPGGNVGINAASVLVGLFLIAVAFR